MNIIGAIWARRTKCYKPLGMLQPVVNSACASLSTKSFFSGKRVKSRLGGRLLRIVQSERQWRPGSAQADHRDWRCHGLSRHPGRRNADDAFTRVLLTSDNSRVFLNDEDAVLAIDAATD